MAFKLFKLKTIYFVFITIISFSTISAQQSALDGQFEVVYTNTNLQLNNSPTVKLVTGFKDQSILVSAWDLSSAKGVVVYQSLDQGDTWNVIIEKKQDSALNFVVSIIQTTQNNICMVVKGFVRDTAQKWISNYWIWYSDDLGQNWVKHNAGGLPLGFHFNDNKGVFASTTNDTAVLWTTTNYGLSWMKRQLPSGMENTAPAMLGDKEFLFFNNTNDGINKDSIYYTSNIDLNLWETKKLHKNFGYNNFIALNRNRILSAFAVWANVGSTALSYILETTDRGDSWKTPVNTLEDSAIARRGLHHNSILDSNNMVFLGPNIIYSSTNGGINWDRAIWADSINGGARGVYLFYNSKLDRRQLIFPVFKSIVRYTIPGVVGLSASILDNNNLKLYPNPSRNSLFIELDQSEKIIGNISVWSIEGKEVLRKKHSSNNSMERMELNVAELGSGIYILKFTTSKGTYCSRFVKQ